MRVKSNILFDILFLLRICISICTHLGLVCSSSACGRNWVWCKYGCCLCVSIRVCGSTMESPVWNCGVLVNRQYGTGIMGMLVYSLYLYWYDHILFLCIFHKTGCVFGVCRFCLWTRMLEKNFITDETFPCDGAIYKVLAFTFILVITGAFHFRHIWSEIGNIWQSSQQPQVSCCTWHYCKISASFILQIFVLMNRL